jgi:hypothetical protein
LPAVASAETADRTVSAFVELLATAAGSAAEIEAAMLVIFPDPRANVTRAGPEDLPPGFEDPHHLHLEVMATSSDGSLDAGMTCTRLGRSTIMIDDPARELGGLRARDALDVPMIIPDEGDEHLPLPQGAEARLHCRMLSGPESALVPADAAEARRLFGAEMAVLSPEGTRDPSLLGIGLPSHDYVSASVAPAPPGVVVDLVAFRPWAPGVREMTGIAHVLTPAS